MRTDMHKLIDGAPMTLTCQVAATSSLNSWR